ncbi:TetR/AcrR family transcriptional regulator C-terminal domain-containing protein [Neobacillus drentensis]
MDSTEKLVQYFVIYANYNVMIGISTMKQLYHTNNHLFIKKGRGMQTVLEKIIFEGQMEGKIITELSPGEITDHLFIAARGVIYDWCLHDGDYNLSEKMQNYMNRLVVIFQYPKL